MNDGEERAGELEKRGDSGEERNEGERREHSRNEWRRKERRLMTKNEVAIYKKEKKGRDEKRQRENERNQDLGRIRRGRKEGKGEKKTIET